MLNANWQSSLNSLESCAAKKGILQSWHPSLKTVFAFCFALCVSSCTGYRLFIFLPYAVLLVFFLAISRIPIKLYFSRLLLALPFSLMAGIWGCFFNTTPVQLFDSLYLASGIIDLISILCRTLLSVGIILILIGTTTIRSVAEGLRFLHLPQELIAIFELIMRYISILFDEVQRMITAWKLRGGNDNSIPIHYYGSFAGSLILRSFNRADRIYQAMQCRGYPSDLTRHGRRPSTIHFIFCILACALCIFIRFFCP